MIGFKLAYKEKKAGLNGGLQVCYGNAMKTELYMVTGSKNNLTVRNFVPQSSTLISRKINLKIGDVVHVVFDELNDQLIVFSHTIDVLYMVPKEKKGAKSLFSTKSLQLEGDIVSSYQDYFLYYNSFDDTILFFGGNVKDRKEDGVLKLNRERTHVSALDFVIKPKRSDHDQYFGTVDYVYKWGSNIIDRNDLWRFDVRTKNWEQLSVPANFPKVKAENVFCISEKYFIVLVKDENEVKKDLTAYVIDLESTQWQITGIIKNEKESIEDTKNNENLDSESVEKEEKKKKRKKKRRKNKRKEKKKDKQENSSLTSLGNINMIIKRDIYSKYLKVQEYRESGEKPKEMTEKYMDTLEDIFDNSQVTEYLLQNLVSINEAKETIYSFRIEQTKEKKIRIQRTGKNYFVHKYSNGSGKYSDLDLIVDEKTYHVHKGLLIIMSNYFDILLRSHVDQEGTNSVELNLPCDTTLFPKILEYFYKGQIMVNEKELVPLFQLAQHLSIDNLVESLELIIQNQLNDQNVFEIFEKSYEKDTIGLVKHAIRYIGKRLSKLETEFIDIFANMPFSIIKILMENVGPNRVHEKILSSFLRSYIEDHSLQTPELNYILSKVKHFSSVDVLNGLYFLQLSEEHFPEYFNYFISIVAKNFDSIRDGSSSTMEDFVKLVSYDTFLELLQSESLVVGKENMVLDTIREFIKIHPDLSQEKQKVLYHQIRLVQLPFEILSSLKSQLPLFWLSKDDFKTVLFSLCLKTSNQDLPIRYQRRQMFEFSYQSDFDKMGILYWLGTNRGLAPYKTDVVLKNVNVTHNGRFETGSISSLISHSPSQCNFHSSHKQEFTIQFKNITISPTHYTLRHTATRATEILRSWDLLGCESYGNFKVISSHKNDTNLKGKSGTYTWKIPNPHETYYHAFKIRITGKDSSNTHYMSIAGFEIYGKIKE